MLEDTAAYILPFGGKGVEDDSCSDRRVRCLVDRPIVREMAQSAEIPCSKVAGRWRFRRAEVDSWVIVQCGVAEPRPDHSEDPGRDYGKI